jgi:hypothetical protein
MKNADLSVRTIFRISLRTNYDHPIYESGVQLIDMVYLQRCL